MEYMHVWSRVAVALGLVLSGCGLDLSFESDPSLDPTPAVLSGTTYYVSSSGGNDANAGTSSAAPWKTLNRVNTFSGGFSPGDQILFKAGDTWSEGIVLHPQGTGDPSTNCGSGVLKIDMYGSGAKPKIVGGGAGGGLGPGTPTGTIWLRDQSCWEIRNLEVTNHGSPGIEEVGIKVEQYTATLARHIYISNNNIHDVNGLVNGYYGSNAAIAVTADMDLYNPCPTWPSACPANPRWDDVRIEDNTVDSIDRMGIFVGPEYQAPGAEPHNWPLLQRNTNIVIRGNMLNNLAGDAILTFVAQGVLMEHNVVSNSGTRVTAPAGCYTACPSPSDYANCNSSAIWTHTTDNSTIQYNEVYNYGLPVVGTGAHQCDGTAFDADQGTTNQLIQYNYSHNNLAGLILFCEDKDAPTGSLTLSNIQVRFNVSYNDILGPFDVACVIDSLPQGPGGARIENNLIVSSGLASSVLDSNNTTALGNASFANNIFYVRSGSSSFPAFANATFTSNVYYGFSSHPSDASGLTSDPKLVQPAGAGIGFASVDGLRLSAGSPALSSGTNTTALALGSLDFWGNSVPAAPTVVNRGAYNGAGLTADSPDLALGAIATLSPNTSYEAEGWGAAKATDGRRESAYFYSEGITTQAYASSATTVDLVVQMPASHSLSKIVLYPRNDYGWAGQGFPQDFTIDVWNAATSTWVTKATVTGLSAPGPAGQTYSWTAVSSDRVRVHATKLGLVPGVGYYLQVAEVELY